MSISQNYPNVSPQLLIELSNTQKLDPRVTFARASTGTYYDANGVLQTAPSGVARFDHNPVTGESLGLLRENQATNLVTYSESQSLNWAVQGAGTFSASSSVAPDGQTGNVTRVQGTVLNDGASKTFTAPSSGQYFGTVFVRSRTGLAQQGKITFSGSTGATINIPATGWTRIGSLSGALGAGAKYVSIRSVGDPIDLDIYGVQTELNFFPTSYIKTEASQVTRAADVATLANVDAYNTDEFTAVTKPFGVSGVASDLVTLNGDAPIERLYVYPRNISQGEINTLVENDGYWSWRIVGADFALPLFVTDGTVEVDWGDGTVETLTTAVHTFTNASPHTVRFKLTSGTFFRPRIDNNATHDLKVVALGSAPSNMIVDCFEGFYGCANLKSFDATLIGGTSFYWAWRGCTSLTSFPLIDTSAGINFDSAWYNCNSLTSFPLIDTSSGTNFGSPTSGRGTWRGCSSLTEFPLLDFSSATNVIGAWYGCTGLTSFPLIDTSNVISFGGSNQGAWTGCTGLTSFPLIDTSSATTLRRAWESCSSLTEFPLIDTSSCVNIQDTWNNCSGLTSFPLIDTSAVTGNLGDATSGNGTWRNCSSLTSFPLLNLSNVAGRADGAWAGCTGLTSFPAIDLPLVTHFGANNQGTWQSCTGLTSFPLINTSSGTGFIKAWYNCTGLTSFPLIDTSSGTNFTQAWRDCSSLTSFPLIDTSSGTNFQQAWQSCSSLTSFPLIDTSSGTDFEAAWYNCSSLTSFPLINTSSGTNFTYAWYNCSSLTDFPANFFDSWVGVPVANCFFAAWLDCDSLTTTSVENILVSIDTSAVSAPATGTEITIDYNVATGALTTPTTNAITSLKAKNWTIRINGVLE